MPLDSSEPVVRSVEARIDETYYQAVLEKPLHELYRILEPHLSNAGVAIDLGCGVGTATLFLLEKGYEVVAIDRERRALEILASRLPEGARVQLVQADMAAHDLPPADVVVAGFSLFFLSQAELEGFWPILVAALRPGGLFAGQFLGPHDAWADKGHALVDRAQVDAMFAGFHVLHLEEVDRDGTTSVGHAKHWHVFHVVARKKV